MWIVSLEDFSDYITQDICVEELQEILLDVHKKLVSGHISAVRKHGELKLA
jgi:uncharacterized protein YeeX (DUF496 family)